MKTTNKISIYISIFALIFGMLFAFTPNQVNAKAKDGYYIGSYMGKEKDTDKLGVISKVVFKKDKMIVYGSLRGVSDSGDVDNFDSYKYYKSKKRTFKLSKKVKFYSTGGTGPTKRLKKKNFINSCKASNKEPDGIGFEFKIKNGKVVSCTFAS